MNRHFLTFLTIGLFACGGAPKGDTTPTAATGSAGGSGDAESSTQSSTDTDTESENARRRKPSDAGQFDVNTADKSGRPTQAKLKATATEAAIRFFVVDKDKGAIKGIVIALTSPTGEKYYTAETDADGFAEVLLPIGQTYELVYLSLGRRDIAAKVKVANEPNLNLKLTMRYQREDYVAAPAAASESAPAPEPRFVLDGVEFASNKATLVGASHQRLDSVVEFMTHKPVSRIEVSGHTDNVGNKKDNKKLSQKRADAVRDYLVSKGIEASRIEAIGLGDEKPIASNDTPEGRQKNRRIEATEKE